MNKTNEQLETVFQEIKEHFADLPEITVTPGEGSRPEQYTVTYHLQGVCKEANGDVQPCKEHIVSITLPFGFPHFPPNCIPESPTFHPDFDASAICIDDIWDEDESIVELIHHMGRMIGGEIFSEANAFNEEAAEWYKKNRDRLPFTASKQEEDSGESPSLSMNSLEDAESTSPSSTGPDDTGNGAFNPESLRLLAQQKQFFTLFQELKGNIEPFGDRAELEEQTESILSQVTSLFDEAHNLEQQEKHQEALAKLDLIEELVTDSPTLQEEKARMQQAFDPLGDWVSQEGEETGPAEIDQDVSHVDDIPGGDITEAEEESTVSPSQQRTFYEEEREQGDRGNRWLFVTSGTIILILAAVLVSSYFFLGSSMGKAKKRYAECQKQLDENNFTAAEQECREALDLMAEVQVVKKNEKTELTEKIRSLLDSPKLRHGLEGRTLVNGRYVPHATKELILAFQKARENGNAFFAKESWQAAEQSYNEALNMAVKTGVEENLLTEIRTKQSRARYNLIMVQGEKALSVSDWDNAKKHFNEALELAQSDNNYQQEDIALLELLSNKTAFNSLSAGGHESFKAGEWNKALENYERALVMAKELNPTKPDTITSLHENIARTKIYRAIEEGKEAFASSQWDTVIFQYEKAITLLEKNSKLLSEINTEESREKLARIMLHAAIIRDKQDAAKYLKEEEYGPAIEQLQNIKQTISASRFADQPEFQAIEEEIASQIGDTEKKMLVLKQATYLTDNYEGLFLKHYPAAAGSTLSAPKVEYLKNIGDAMLFRMQCTETAGGRPLRLQMDYLYSPASDSWQFYSSEE